MLVLRMMQLHLPIRPGAAALITGCCVLLGGCAVLQRKVSPVEHFPWSAELGTSQPGSANVPAEATALGHFLKAELALNQGDHELATKEYERAVAHDPASALLRLRLATLYVRANRL